MKKEGEEKGGGRGDHKRSIAAPLSLESRKFEIQMQLLRIKKQQKTGFKLTQKKSEKVLTLHYCLPPSL